MKRVLFLIWFSVFAGIVAASLPAAGATSISEAAQTLSIDGTPLTVDVPEHWENVGHPPKGTTRAGRQWLEANPRIAQAAGLSDDEFLAAAKKDLKYLVLDVIDTNGDGIGDGDNLAASLYRDGQKFNSIGEWKAAQEFSAQSTKSTVLSDSQGRAGKYHIFTHLERYPNGVLFAMAEVDLPGPNYVQFSMTLDPGSEALVQRILASVRG